MEGSKTCMIAKVKVDNRDGEQEDVINQDKYQSHKYWSELSTADGF